MRRTLSLRRSAGRGAGGDRSEQREADDEPIALVTENVRVLNSANGKNRLGGTAFGEHEERQQHDAEHRQHDRRREPHP